MNLYDGAPAVSHKKSKNLALTLDLQESGLVRVIERRDIE